MVYSILKKAMYGASDAVPNWEMEYTKMMVKVGFKQGSHSACVFYREEENVRVAVHGDESIALEPSKCLDWLRGASPADGGQVQE